jgi:hypothetical protein
VRNEGCQVRAREEKERIKGRDERRGEERRH